MTINKISYVLASIMLFVSMLACNIGAPATPDQSEPSVDTSNPEVATEAPTTALEASPIGMCENPLLPIKVGATWNYKLTGPIPDTFTRSILTVEANGFTDQDAFGAGVTRQSQWQCENGNLIALNPSGGGSSSVSTENVTVDFQTTELSGVTLPATINPGDTWSQSIKLEGAQTINGESFPAKNHTTSDCTAVGNESVTVEAGTFDAFRFDCQINIKITLTMQGNDFDTPLSFVTNHWYAPNIGLVKSVSTGSGLDSTIELTSYSIP